VDLCVKPNAQRDIFRLCGWRPSAGVNGFWGAGGGGFTEYDHGDPVGGCVPSKSLEDPLFNHHSKTEAFDLTRFVAPTP
jgi:hypothetical protein